MTFAESLESVVCLGAHPDDIEIGALALLSRLGDSHPKAHFTFVILSGETDRRREAESSAKALLGDRVSLQVADFRDGYLPYDEPGGVKDYLREAVGRLSPQMVVAPHTADLHQDHAFVGELANQLFRQQIIINYEIAKYDGDLGAPNAFVVLDTEEVERKLDHLNSHFATQQGKGWYEDDAFRALLRLRGIESGSPFGFAEGFHISKMWVE